MNYDKKYLVMLLLFAIIILLVPTAIRLINGNPYPPNSDTYLHMRLNIIETIHYDELQARSTQFNILNLIRFNELSPNNDLLQKIFFRVIPILLGALSILFAYLTLYKQNVPEKTTLTILALIISSPIFIYLFGDYKIYAFTIFLSILGIYLLTHNRSLLSGIIFAIIPFIDLLSAIIVFIGLSIYLLSNHKHKHIIRITTIIIFGAILLSMLINISKNYPISNIFIFYAHNILTDIGAEIGISFSILILAIIGLTLLWENGWRNMLLYSIIILLFAISIFNDIVRIYVGLIMMIYAGFAFIYLERRKWSINIIKKTTILLIICSILFSTIVYITKLSHSEPTPGYVDALEFIRSQSLPNEVILSNPENGYMIEYYSDRMALADTTTKFYNNEKYSLIDSIATSRNLERTEKMFNEYNIKYIVIGKEFAPYLKEKEGLLFLMENSKAFLMIYQDNDVEIWMYSGDKDGVE
jgi:hypothetical protein